MSHDCPATFCEESFDTGDKLADHLTDEHDAFSKVLQGETA